MQRRLQQVGGSSLRSNINYINYIIYNDYGGDRRSCDYHDSCNHHNSFRGLNS